MAALRSRTALLPRLLAIVICAGCVVGIVRLAQQAAPMATATGVVAAGGDCVARKRAEIEQEKAAGRITAEQAMIRRQKIKAECG
jgi:hypothetical protein